MLLWRPSGEAASAGSAIKPVCIVRTDWCPFRNDYTFDCGATSHVTPSRAAAREVATGRPPPTRTTPLRPLALSFHSLPKKSHNPRVFDLTKYPRDLRDRGRAPSPQLQQLSPHTNVSSPSWKVRRGHVGISSELKVLGYIKRAESAESAAG